MWWCLLHGTHRLICNLEPTSKFKLADGVLRWWFFQHAWRRVQCSSWLSEEAYGRHHQGKRKVGAKAPAMSLVFVRRYIYMSSKIVNHFCRAPLLGGQFAAWGICFSSFDCTFAHIRGKEVHLGFLLLELSLDLFSSSGSLEFHHVWSSCRGSDGC